MPPKPPVEAMLQWTGDLAFTAHVTGHTVVVDGDGVKGPSPVQSLAIAIAGCMGTDVALILTRSRQPLQALEVRLSADRASDDPHRLVAVRLHFAVTGAVEPARLERAIQLSREKYCSVWFSLRQDIPLDVTSAIQA